MSLRKSVFDPLASRFGYERKKQSTIPHVGAVESIPETEKKAFLPAWYWMSEYGQPRAINIDDLRTLAKSPTAWMCIRRLLDDVMSTAWEIMPIPEENKDKPSEKAKEHARIIRNWFNGNLNQNRESWMHITGQMVVDLLELDAGVLVKEYARGSSHYMTQIWARDAARFLKDVDEYGVLGRLHDYEGQQNFNVGYWKHDYTNSVAIPYEPHEIVYLLQRPDTRTGRHGIYGTAPMEIASLILRACMKGEEWIDEYFTEGATGSLGVTVESASPTSPTGLLSDDDWKTWTTRLSQQMTAKYIKKVYMDGKVTFNPLGIPPEAIKWLETKDEYRHLVMALYGVTSEVLGFTRDIPKATAESQRDLYVQRGLKPLLDMVEYAVNMQVVTEFFWSEPKEYKQVEGDEESFVVPFMHNHQGKFAGEPVDVMFRYKLYDPIGERRRIEVDELRLKNGLTKINEIRAREGLPKLPWGDINPIFLFNPQQFSQSLYFGAYGREQLEEMTGIPKAPEGADLTAVQQALRQSTQPLALRQGEPTKAFKLSRIPQTQMKPTETKTNDWQKLKLKQDLMLLLKGEFQKAEVPVPAWQHVEQAVDLLLAKLKTGRWVEEVLEEWFKTDFIQQFIFAEIGQDLIAKIQLALRSYFGQKPAEQYERPPK